MKSDEDEQTGVITAFVALTATMQLAYTQTSLARMGFGGQMGGMRSSMGNGDGFGGGAMPTPIGGFGPPNSIGGMGGHHHNGGMGGWDGDHGWENGHHHKHIGQKCTVHAGGKRLPGTIIGTGMCYSS